MPNKIRRYYTAAMRWWYYFCYARLGLPKILVQPIKLYQERRLVRQFKLGDIVEDCRYHPCVIIAAPVPTPWWQTPDDDITVRSLLDRSLCGCSLFHCGIYHLTPAGVNELYAAWYANPRHGLALARGWSEAAHEQFLRDWVEDN